MTPNPGTGNPILDEIDRAHSTLSPEAQEAIRRAGAAAIPQNPLGTPADPFAGKPVSAPRPAPAPLAMAPSASPTAETHTARLAQLTAPPVPGLEHTKASTGQSGIGQIHNPVGRTLLQVADAVGGGLFPGIEQRLPGTQGHHDVLVRQAQRDVTSDEAAQKAEDESALHHAQTENQEAIPELNRTKADLAASKLGETTEHNRAEEAISREREAGREETTQASTEGRLRQNGMKHDPVTHEIVPLDYSEMSEDQKSVHDLKVSQKELADARTDLVKAQKTNIPSQLALAQKRVENAAATRQTAMERLGLSEKQYEMRAHGTENGQALPGSLIGENNQPVGTAFQQNVRPTGTQRDAAGRAGTMLDVDSRIRQALKNPEIQKGTGPIAGRLSEIENRVGTLPHDLAELKNDLVSYGAFQAGLHPVRGIGALQYFDKVMGGLGQTPEELVGKLDSNKKTAGSVMNVGKPKVTGGGEQIIEYVRDKDGKLVPKGGK